MKLETYVLILFCVVIAAFMFMFGLVPTPASNTACTLRGGVTVKTVHGWECIRADVIK